MKVNDWWNRYVRPSDRPREGMQGYHFRQKRKTKACAEDCVCYACRDRALMEALKRRET
jgi:queuine/archaeosine tRNA-ribosyltransferase